VTARHNPGNSRRHHPQRLANLQTYQTALELRIKGHSYPEIAHRLGYKNHSSAIDAIQKGIALVLREPAEQCRAIELSRLDTLLSVWWQKAIHEVVDDDGVVRREAGSLKAADMVLRIIAQRCRIAGLDRAIKEEREDAREVILAILKRVVSEDDTRTRTEETLAVAQWRPADVTGDVVMTDDRPPRLPPPPGVEDEAPAPPPVEPVWRPLEEDEDAEPQD
jgi:hypothetical protein